MGLELDKGGRLRVNAITLQTNRKGLFAGGDLVTGPNTVVNAIAAPRKAAPVIDRYIHGKELAEPPELKLPSFFIEPAVVGDEELEDAQRVKPATLNARSRKKSFAEVEMALSVEQATQEAHRSLRCDLEFTQRPESEEAECVGGRPACLPSGQPHGVAHTPGRDPALREPKSRHDYIKNKRFGGFSR